MAARSNWRSFVDSLQQLRPLEQRGEGDAHLLPGGPRAGGEEKEGERVDLGIRKPVAGAVLVFDLRFDQDADQVVLGRRSPRRHDGLDDLHDLRRPAQRLTNVEGLLDGYAKAAGDGQDRDGRTEIHVELGPAVVDKAVDEQVHGPVDPVLDPPPGPGRHERRLHQGAVTPVLRSSHREHAVEKIETATRQINRGRGTRRTAGHCDRRCRRRRS